MGHDAMDLEPGVFLHRHSLAVMKTDVRCQFVYAARVRRKNRFCGLGTFHDFPGKGCGLGFSFLMRGFPPSPEAGSMGAGGYQRQYLLVKMHVSERVANFVCIFTMGPLCWACLGRLFMRGWPFLYAFVR